MSDDVLWVFWGDDEQPCGLVRRDASGAGVTFRYLEGNTHRISHSLPVETVGDVAGVFFEGLLPDGVERERLARRLGVSDASTFALLAAVGGDCAGALSLHATEERPKPSGVATRPLDTTLLREVEENGPLPTIVAHGLRLSLAGAQAKLAVVLHDDGTLGAPEGRTPSTHILKLPNRDYRSVVDNEHFVMTLAKNAGLVVPRTRLWKLPSGANALLVERFDRRGSQRLHQEDFCQATGLHPARKYEGDGGPSLAKIVDVLTAASSEPLDPLRLVAMQAFNIAVANNDGHAKNFALVREPSVSLAPSSISFARGRGPTSTRTSPSRSAASATPATSGRGRGQRSLRRHDSEPRRSFAPRRTSPSGRRARSTPPAMKCSNTGPTSGQSTT